MVHVRTFVRYALLEYSTLVRQKFRRSRTNKTIKSVQGLRALDSPQRVYFGHSRSYWQENATRKVRYGIQCMHAMLSCAAR